MDSIELTFFEIIGVKGVKEKQVKNRAIFPIDKTLFIESPEGKTIAVFENKEYCLEESFTYLKDKISHKVISDD